MLKMEAHFSSLNTGTTIRRCAADDCTTLAHFALNQQHVPGSPSAQGTDVYMFHEGMLFTKLSKDCKLNPE